MAARARLLSLRLSALTRSASHVHPEPPKETQHHPSSVDMVIIDALLRKGGEMTLMSFLTVGCMCLYEDKKRREKEEACSELMTHTSPHFDRNACLASTRRGQGAPLKASASASTRT